MNDMVVNALRGIFYMLLVIVIISVVVAVGSFYWTGIQRISKDRAANVQTHEAAIEKDHRHICGELYLPVEVEVVAIETFLTSGLRSVTVKGSSSTPFVAEVYLSMPSRSLITIDDLSGPEFIIPCVGDRAILDWNEKEKRLMLLRIKPTGK